MERVFRTIAIPTGERVEGVELSGEDHPGHDPVAPAAPAAFVRYVAADGTVARMEKHADELRANEWMDRIQQKVDG